MAMNTTGWREEFDKKFPYLGDSDYDVSNVTENVKAFISAKFEELINEDIPQEKPLPDFDEYKRDGRAESEWTADYHIAAARNSLIRELKTTLLSKWK